MCLGMIHYYFIFQLFFFFSHGACTECHLNIWTEISDSAKKKRSTGKTSKLRTFHHPPLSCPCVSSRRDTIMVVAKFCWRRKHHNNNNTRCLSSRKCIGGPSNKEIGSKVKLPRHHHNLFVSRRSWAGRQGIEIKGRYLLLHPFILQRKNSNKNEFEASSFETNSKQIIIYTHMALR
jgi:hypothetical protein